jgi:hypothetical protein
MFRLFMLCVVALPFCFATAGCGGGDPKPKVDPNFKTSTNPSDITVPEGFKRTPKQAIPAKK